MWFNGDMTSSRWALAPLVLSDVLASLPPVITRHPAVLLESGYELTRLTAAGDQTLEIRVRPDDLTDYELSLDQPASGALAAVLPRVRQGFGVSSLPQMLRRMARDARAASRLTTSERPGQAASLSDLGAAFTATTTGVWCSWAEAEAQTNYDGATHFCQFCGATDHEPLSR